MRSITLVLDDAIADRLSDLAGASGRSQDQLVREAIGDLLRRSDRLRRPIPGLGAFASGRDDVAERADALLGARSPGQS